MTKNNQNEIVNTLESIKEIGPILIADLGSKDKTVELCKKYNAEVFNFDFQYDFSKVKNTLAFKVNTEWLFWLEPGEEIISGPILEHLQDDMYRVMIVRGDLLTKSPRIYRKGKGKFINPAFEQIEDVSKKTLPVIVGGEGKQDMRLVMESLIKWQENSPLDPEPTYYIACHHLMTKNFDKFINLAESYLFKKEKLDASAVMIRYYLALLLRNKNPNKTLKLILECIAAYPLMAEFWCLLADFYLIQMKQPDKAYIFYDNAKILGSRRLTEDTMPMEISKYDDYPTKMMTGIINIINKLPQNV